MSLTRGTSWSKEQSITRPDEKYKVQSTINKSRDSSRQRRNTRMRARKFLVLNTDLVKDLKNDRNLSGTLTQTNMDFAVYADSPLPNY